MRLIIYMAKRLVYIIPVIFLLTIFVFAMIHLLPGNPADILLAGEGGAEDPVVRAALMKELGLDKPIPVQYGMWLWRALHGNFGKSVYSQEEVFRLIFQRFPATILLAFSAMIVSILIALPAGIISAVKRQKAADYGAMIFALLGISLPEFWFGIMLILTFSLWLRWLPSMGFMSPFESFFGSLKFLILPSVALGLRMAGVVTRMTRSSMLDELGQEFAGEDRHLRPYLEERPHSHGHRGGPAIRDHPGRDGRHRDGLQLARARTAPRRRHPDTRLPGRAGGGSFCLLPFRLRQLSC